MGKSPKPTPPPPDNTGLILGVMQQNMAQQMEMQREMAARERQFQQEQQAQYRMEQQRQQAEQEAKLAEEEARIRLEEEEAKRIKELNERARNQTGAAAIGDEDVTKRKTAGAIMAQGDEDQEDGMAAVNRILGRSYGR